MLKICKEYAFSILFFESEDYLTFDTIKVSVPVTITHYTLIFPTLYVGYK